MKPIQFTVPVYGGGVFALLEDRVDNFYAYYHRHEELQITCILKGRGTIMIGNVVQSFQEGDLFVLIPNEPHMLDKYGHDAPVVEDVHAIHVFVNLTRMQGLFAIPEFASVRDFLLNLEVSQKLEAPSASGLANFFLQLVERTSVPRFIEFISLLHTLTLRAGEMVSLYTGTRKLTYSDKEGVRISAVYKYTFDHFNRAITVGEVAALIHMTPTAFCKFFKKHTMKTYVGFLNEVRIERACQMLINKLAENISEAAFQVGFNNIIHFNRVFKQVMKISPRKYLARHRA